MLKSHSPVIPSFSTIQAEQLHDKYSFYTDEIDYNIDLTVENEKQIHSPFSLK